MTEATNDHSRHDRRRSDQAGGPRLVFFEVSSRRELARRAAAAAPGVRFASRRDWTADPGEPRPPLLGGDPPVGLWFWKGTAQEFTAVAGDVLLHLVHPLVGRGLPFCLGFPFAARALDPQSLPVGDTVGLDLEDIARLLQAAAARDTTHRAGHADTATHTDAATRTGRRRRRARDSDARDATSDGHVVRPVGGPDAVRLDAAQRAAVLHRQGPARVLAPAGSGKTKTLVSRVVELVDRGVDPAGILMLAFNRKAAEQLEERLAALGVATTRRLGAPAEEDAPNGGVLRRRPASRAAAASRNAPGSPERPPGAHCATFNAFGYRYQREVLRTRITLDHDGRALRPLMARAVQTAGVSLRELKPRRGSDPIGAFLAGLTRVRAALEPVDDVTIHIESLTDTPLVAVPFAATHTQFTRAQVATGLQSFDDQIYFAVADLLADPSHRAFIQDRFDHVLVDEFQDLNGAQLALVDILSRPGRDLFVVGDDDQLIYGWRHADPRGILEFHRRMPPRPWSATYTLGTNYRCSRAVVETGARLVANNLTREDKQIRPRAGAQDGEVAFCGAPSWPERAARVCHFLRREKSRLACGWSDLAVLCRYRAQQLLVALALDADDVPRSPALGCTLFTHAAARLLRAYLELLRAPDEVPAADLATLLNRPNRFVPAAAVETIATAARPWARLRALATSEPANGQRPLTALVELAAGLRRELAAAPAITSDDLVWSVVETFELDDLWAAEADAAAADGGASDGGGPLEVFDSLLLLAEAYPEPSAYLRTWDRLLADEDASASAAAGAGSGSDHGAGISVGNGIGEPAADQPQDDRVVIGTIHAAKGREYQSVVIPDYDCDISRCAAAEIEEERRVVYVGVTRARDAVLFTVDTSRGFVHPFLRELVEMPDPEEHATLVSWLDEERGDDLRRLVAARLAEIEVLYPELVPADPAAAHAGQSRMDGSGGATKCLAVGSVPGCR